MRVQRVLRAERAGKFALCRCMCVFTLGIHGQLAELNDEASTGEWFVHIKQEGWHLNMLFFFIYISLKIY